MILDIQHRLLDMTGGESEIPPHAGVVASVDGRLSDSGLLRVAEEVLKTILNVNLARYLCVVKAQHTNFYFSWLLSIDAYLGPIASHCVVALAKSPRIYALAIP